jgi:hypothetical protein
VHFAWLSLHFFLRLSAPGAAVSLMFVAWPKVVENPRWGSDKLRLHWAGMFEGADRLCFFFPLFSPLVRPVG